MTHAEPEPRVATVGSATNGGPGHEGSPLPPEFPKATVDPDLTPFLRILLTGRHLSAQDTERAFTAMMTGDVHHGEIGAFLALLAARTPSADEIQGAARVMRANVDRLSTQVAESDLVDTAGTGGAPKTFNVSTAAAIVAASGGARVAKHGNRSRTGRGSAEVLARLGVNVDAGRAVQRRCLEEAGVCFCFAIHHHPATRHVMPVRLALGVPTIFNLLGPLTNPAGARRQVMGVYERRFVRPIAEALANLGAIRAMVMHSEDGLDEFSISAPTRIAVIRDGLVFEELLDPQDYGIEPAPREALVGRDLDHAAAIVRAVLSGAEKGPPRWMVLLNAAATLQVAGLAGSWSEGLVRAADLIDRGAAARTLEHLVRLSNEPAARADSVG
ncbi:MAG: anthranilate phosphoribosyltransferase [Phycisphaeraceae bacterium]|nr:anthranilate phosphoribosyltransferase [Phycisphaeraceae bacterium]